MILNIGILGGGIGGLSTAIALKQAGFSVSVYERHSKPTEIGAGIICWPNACFVLEQLGVLDKVAQVSGSINYMNRFSKAGDPIGSLDVNELSRLMTYPSYSIIRKDLMFILTARAIELNIPINYQHDVVELSTINHDANNKNGKTSVQFSNKKIIQPDIIIGADGRMKSLTRQFVNGNNTPIYQGFINWVGVVEYPLEEFTDISVSDYWGVGERFGIVPVSKNKAYWAGGAVANKVGDVDPNIYKAELTEMFSDWPSNVVNTISDTPQSRIHKVYVHDHDPIDTWHKSNVILVGDAAHSPLPTSGQGACQALEDAWHLTRCLTDNTNNVDKAFSQLTELRKPKTSGITMGGRQLASSIFNQDIEYCHHRNQASKNTDYKNVAIGMAKGWSSGLPIET